MTTAQEPDRCVNCDHVIGKTPIGWVHYLMGQDMGWLCPSPQTTLATPPAKPSEKQDRRPAAPPLPRRTVPRDWPTPLSRNQQPQTTTAGLAKAQ